MERQIEVGNLPNSINSRDLLRLFEEYGAVRSAIVAEHLETGVSTGLGLVEMESAERGTAAIAALNLHEHFGRVLLVCWNDASANPIADHGKMFGPMNMINHQTGKQGSD
jgi:RNA recognition motif-containing protein